MVLFPDSLSAFRPVYLLDVAGKVLENVVALRLEAHLCREMPGPQKVSTAFGGIDAFGRVSSLIEEAMR
jgi:hypothetical protein